MGVQQDFSGWGGLGRSAYPGVTPGGNRWWSQYDTRLVEYVPAFEIYDAAAVIPGDQGAYGVYITLLLFGADYPTNIIISSHYGPFDLPFSAPSGWAIPEYDGILLDPTDVLVTPKIVNVTRYKGQDYPGIVEGNTVSNGVPVKGYFAGCGIYDMGIIIGVDEPGWCQVHYHILYNSAEQAGPIEYSDFSGVKTGRWVGLLKESDYTQAIADNDDVVNFSFFGVNYSMQVIGLWKAQSLS